MHEKLSREEMLDAIMKKDASFDGLLFAGIVTTGIFCKPSCPSKRPLPANVEFYASAKEALFAGFRPCERCRPLDAPGGNPEWVSRLLAMVDRDPEARIRDAGLMALGLDPATVRRYFQKKYGMSFQAYSRARRLGSAFSAIKAGSPLDDVILGHGWDSFSGFRDAFVKATGRTPGGARDSNFIKLAWIETPMGGMVAGATRDDAGKECLCLLEFSDRRMLEAQMKTLKSRFKLALFPAESPLFESLKTKLDEYFKGQRKDFDIPLLYPGSAFQTEVWNALRKVPYGETRCYGDIAAAIGKPGAVRAVGTANGMNRIAILIPCHRVINADGALGGYGGGLWRKLRLLELEGAKR